MNKLPNNICLTFHCIYKSKEEEPKVNKELFIEFNELRNFCLELKKNDYNFCIPSTANKKAKNCIITFDDGYFNNNLFLEIAEEFKIPFIIFLSGYNIETQTPFIWDTILNSKLELNYWNTNYDSSYELVKEFKSKLMDSVHRPFTLNELNGLSNSEYLNFGFHSYFHQPFTSFGEKFIDRELDKSDEFMKKISNKKINHFAFPNGLYTFNSLKKIEKKYDYIYTIQSGEFKIGDKLINRFSLLNTSMYGSLEEQILRANSSLRKLYRKIQTIKFSYF